MLERFIVGTPDLKCNKHSSIKVYYKNWDSTKYGSWKEYFKFAVVRNPWDRAVSYYFHVLQHSKYNPWSTGKEFCRDDFKKLISGTLDPIHRKPRYVDFTPEIKTHLSLDNNLVVNVLKFENLQNDFSEICETYGLEGVLPHVNKSRHTANTKSYVEYYDDELREIIAIRFQREIREFGYKFEGT